MEVELSADVDVRGASSVARHSFEVTHLEVGIGVEAHLEELGVEEVSRQRSRGVRDGGQEAVNVHLGGVEGERQASTIKRALIDIAFVVEEQALVGLVEQRRGQDEVGSSAVRSLNLAVNHQVGHLRNGKSATCRDELVIQVGEGRLIQTTNNVVLSA